MLVGIYIDGLAASCLQRWRRSTSHLAEALMWLTHTYTKQHANINIKKPTNDVNWDFPAAGEMREIIFWPILGVKEGAFDSSGFSAEAIFIFVFVVFHRGCSERLQENNRTTSKLFFTCIASIQTLHQSDETNWVLTCRVVLCGGCNNVGFRTVGCDVVSPVVTWPHGVTLTQRGASAEAEDTGHSEEQQKHGAHAPRPHFCRHARLDYLFCTVGLCLSYLDLICEHVVGSFRHLFLVLSM